MKRIRTPLILILLLLGISSALAMSSPSYGLDWFTPMTSSGGGAASSPNFSIDFTLGQTAVGLSASGSYGSSLGYWYRQLGPIEQALRIFLPLVSR